MGLKIDKASIERYQDDGFLHLPSFLDANNVADLKSAVLDAVGDLGRTKIAGGDSDWEEGDAYYDRVFTQRLNLWRVNSRVRDYMLDAQLGEALSRLAGVDRFRVWHDQALIKEPNANPTAWHLDVPYWSFCSRHAISIWIALEDTTLSNGCLYFLPGSHKIARYDNVTLDDNFGSLFDVYPEMGDLEPVAVPMKAGDCSFHNGLTAHCAGPNISRGRRIGMTCAYMPDGSTFNGQKNILPQSYFDDLAEGDILNDETLNPLVYST